MGFKKNDINGISAIIGLIILLSQSLHAQGVLRIEVVNVRNLEGNILIGLFDDEKNFLKNAFRSEIVQASANKVLVLIKDLPPGDYALSVVHDENKNEKLDTNFLGIPKEGFGFGNNAMGNFGPPSFDKAMIRWQAKDMDVSVRLRYY